MPQAHSPLGPTELDILRFIVERHPVRVAEVAGHIARASGQARTTVLTTMERLRRKKFLTRRKIGGAWHYSPTRSKPQFLADLVANFVKQVLHGSVSPFVAYLANAEDLSNEELALLKRQIRSLELKRKEGASDE